MLTIRENTENVWKVFPTETTKFLTKNYLLDYMIVSTEFVLIPEDIRKACIFSIEEFGEVSEKYKTFANIFVYVGQGRKTTYTVEIAQEIKELCKNRTKALDAVLNYMIQRECLIFKNSIREKILEEIYNTEICIFDVTFFD